MLNLDKLIAEASIKRDKPKLSVYRAIKAEEMNYIKASNAKPLDDVAEIQIIKKLASQHKESIDMYLEAADKREKVLEEQGRQDESVQLYRNLAEEKKEELEVMRSLLPAEVSKDDIIAAVIAWAVAESNGESIPKARMGEAIKAVKAKFPTADGKLVADSVKERLA